MRSFVLLAALALACTPDTGDTDASTTDASTTVTPTATSVTTDADTSTGDASTTEPTTTGSTSGDNTTGEAAWCHGWDGADGEPHLELYNDTVLLADGGTLALECGGQGLFMFGLYPEFGGFTPASDNIGFDLVVDVEGHNSNPDGHFYSTVDAGYYVGCEDLIGGLFGVVPVFPPDNDDPLLLDGLPATLHVVMHSGADSVTLDMNVTLSVQPADDFAFCG